MDLLRICIRKDDGVCVWRAQIENFREIIKSSLSFVPLADEVPIRTCVPEPWTALVWKVGSKSENRSMHAAARDAQHAVPYRPCDPKEQPSLTGRCQARHASLLQRCVDSSMRSWLSCESCPLPDVRLLHGPSSFASHKRSRCGCSLRKSCILAGFLAAASSQCHTTPRADSWPE